MERLLSTGKKAALVKKARNGEFIKSGFAFRTMSGCSDYMELIDIEIMSKKAKSNFREVKTAPKSYLVHFGAKTFFFRKSKNVTFLDLSKANLMQKIRKI